MDTSVKTVSLGGTQRKTMKTYPKGILKQAASTKRTLGGAVKGKPVVYEEHGAAIVIKPTKNPTIPIRRPRKHFHGTRKLALSVSSSAHRTQRVQKIQSEVKDLDRAELLEKLKGHINPNTKAPTELLKQTYKNLKLSMLMD